ncbi:MAG: beta-propeller domain-containing protein [Deltaproteobacteria bacterium]|nr:beta-propeller domain-containing protein [Deltaproteobacteria bacterium]MBN2670454.1 beta-propeller domain-containing protein [Deltaproteobacteria bacterium]
MHIKIQLSQITYFILLSLFVAAFGCSVKHGSDDEPTDSDSDTNTIVTPDPRGPSGISLTSLQDTDVRFPENSYEDGPVLDDTRAMLRAIQEADIVQVVGDRLYAISQASGLVIVDMSVSDQLSQLGRYRTAGKPFEMYVRGDRIIAMLKEIPVQNSDGRTIRTQSQIVTLNVADPSAVSEVSAVDVPGEIIDSRILDNILYVASYEISYNDDSSSDDSYYYDEYGYEELVDSNAIDMPTTTVISFDVSDSTNITEVQRLSYDEIEQSWADRGWSKKAISISDDRLYVAGPSDGEHSTIQVIDISSATGELVEGTTVQVDGAIWNRWQIDEYEGILRVVSQPPDSYNAIAPVVQTFTINSSQDITALGTLPLVLPQAEKLRSVRFDEDRVYVVTFEQLDPLFIIDLTDPSTPVQAGEITDMPGWVHHLEPRGDRLIGLGFEPGGDGGGLHVSLFDVSDMTNPSQLSRVNFGPNWSSAYYMYEHDVDDTFTEDQSRIHKLFRVFDDIGLIVVPFSGWGGEEQGCGEYSSGVQLVTLADDTLTKRALIGDTGIVRRAFLNDDRMVMFSEDKLQLFNLDDLDTPVRTAFLPLTMRVHRTAVFGDHVVRIASDWNERVAFADIVPLADINNMESAAPFDLANYIYDDNTSCEYHNDAPFMNTPLFQFGSHLAMPIVHPVEGEDYYATDLLVLNTEGNTLTLAAQVALDFEPINTGLGQGVVQIGDMLLFQRPGDDINEAGNMQNIAIEVIDMSTPASPTLLSPSIVRPFAAGTTGMHLRNNIVSNGFFSYDDEGYVDYYLDRTDFTVADAPESLEPILFPGLYLGPFGTDYIGIDFVWEYEAVSSESECNTLGGEYDSAQGVCWFATRALQRIAISDGTATAVSSTELSNDALIRALYQGENRYYMTGVNAASTSSDYYLESDYGPKLIVIVGIEGNGIALKSLDMGWGYDPRSPVVADDTLYYLSGNYLYSIGGETVDTTTYSYNYLNCAANHVSINGTQAIVSCGDRGVQIVELGEDS